MLSYTLKSDENYLHRRDIRRYKLFGTNVFYSQSITICRWINAAWTSILQYTRTLRKFIIA